MHVDEEPHSDAGLLALLKHPALYRAFSRLLVRRSFQQRLVQQYIRPWPGCRILDVGCGPANLLEFLPDATGLYHGVDMNPSYIDFARSRWRDRPNCRFDCGDVGGGLALDVASYDIIVAVALLHHLDDEAAGQLMATIAPAVAPGGRLVTYDAVFVVGQHWFADWLIRRDRGKAVRTVDGYVSLARTVFAGVRGELIHDSLRVPYTTFIMTCQEGAVREPE